MTTEAQVVTTQSKEMMTHGNGEVRPQVNPNASTPASIIRDSTRMNPPTFHVTKVDEDPLGFIDEAFKVVDVMGVIFRENVELSHTN